MPAEFRFNVGAFLKVNIYVELTYFYLYKLILFVSLRNETIVA